MLNAFKVIGITKIKQQISKRLVKVDTDLLDHNHIQYFWKGIHSYKIMAIDR